MRSGIKRYIATMLIAAMSVIPAFSSLAAPEDEMPAFAGFFTGEEDPFAPEDQLLPGALNPDGSVPGEWNFAIASPSDMSGIFIPGGFGGMWGAPQDPFDGAAAPDMMPSDGSEEYLYNTVGTYDDESVDTSDEAEEESDAEAAEDEADTEYYAKILVYDIANMAPNDELLAGYIDELFYGKPDDTPFSDYWRSILSTDEQEFYDEIKDFIGEIAAADEDYPVFDASGNTPTLKLSRERLGLSESASYTEWYEAAMNYYLENTVNVNRIMNYIYRDDPYDLYWSEGSYVVSFTAYIEDEDCVITMQAVYFPAEDDYQGDFVDELDRYDIYYVDNEEIMRAMSAADTAREIVEDHEGEEAGEMLAAYIDEIARLALGKDYISSPDSDEWDDPWQAVCLFDTEFMEDLTSEAYARAFEYLCGMSGFEDCYTVKGRRSGAAHMWNVVELDGVFYVADPADGYSMELVPVGSGTAQYVYEGV